MNTWYFYNWTAKPALDIHSMIKRKDYTQKPNTCSHYLGAQMNLEISVSTRAYADEELTIAKP